MELSDEYRAYGEKLEKVYSELEVKKGSLNELLELLKQIGDMEKIAAVSGRARCLRVGIKKMRKQYPDFDSGNGVYLVEDYDFQGIKKVLGEFINFYYGGCPIIKE